MLTTPRDYPTVEQLQELLEVIFRARDELYLAADSLVGPDRGYICRCLGDQLGGHAADLQQIISASGEAAVGPHRGQDAQAMFDSIQTQAGDSGVLQAAEQTEHRLLERYDWAIEHLGDQEVTGLLCRQREELEFADRILRILTT